jgi:hypothetical protein
MESVLARCFREHKDQEAWCHKIKTNSKVPSNPSHVGVLAPDEAPEESSLSKLLGITMLQLREVLVNCNLAKKRGQFHMILRQNVQDFIETKGLTGFLVFGESNKVLVMCASAFHEAISQPSTNGNLTKITASSSHCHKQIPRRPCSMFGRRKKSDQDNNASNASIPAKHAKHTKHTKHTKHAKQRKQSSTSSNVTSFLSKMLTSRDVMLDPSFFNKDLVGLENLFVQTCFKTCELERKKEKEKKQEAVSAAVEVQIF